MANIALLLVGDVTKFCYFRAMDAAKTGLRQKSRHGLRLLKVQINHGGWGRIDKRTAAGQELIRWRKELFEDLGGEESVSTQRKALVDLICRTRLFLDSIDAWLLAQPRLTLRHKRALLPAVRERQQLVDSLARLLGQLGLERVPKKVPTLQEYIASKVENGVRKEGGA
jgi:hypothetical protein